MLVQKPITTHINSIKLTWTEQGQQESRVLERDKILQALKQPKKINCENFVDFYNAVLDGVEFLYHHTADDLQDTLANALKSAFEQNIKITMKRLDNRCLAGTAPDSIPRDFKTHIKAVIGECFCPGIKQSKPEGARRIQELFANRILAR